MKGLTCFAKEFKMFPTDDVCVEGLLSGKWKDHFGKHTGGLWKIKGKSRIKINKVDIATVYIRSNEGFLNKRDDCEGRNRFVN